MRYGWGMSETEKDTTENPALRLCYVDGPWAYFAPHDPIEVWGDDWNDAPYEHNAGEPYEKFGPVCVAWLGTMEAPCDGHLNSPWTVEEINRGEVPWLTSPSWRNGLCVKIWAGVTLAEFITLVRQDGGEVYLPAPTTPPTTKEGA